MSQTIQILQNHLALPQLGGIICAAIEFVSSSHIEEVHGPTGSGQSSKSLAKLHNFRKRIGYYKRDAIVGLDETIALLDSDDIMVWARIIETDRGYVAVWLDADEVPFGVMIFKKIVHQVSS